MTDIHSRTGFAQELTRQLLRPGVLDLPMRSGLFLSDGCRTGRATFLRQHLIPALEAEHSAIVIYMDLWSDVDVPSAELILRAVRAKLQELATDGFRFKFDLDTLGEESGATLAEAFRQVVDETEMDLVLLVDEVQRCLGSEDAMLMALKAARDAVNLRRSTAGHFLLVCAGFPRSVVQNMTLRNEAPFAGAVFRDLSGML